MKKTTVFVVLTAIIVVAAYVFWPKIKPAIPVLGECKIVGCSSQLCIATEVEGMVTSCEQKPEYKCFEGAKCEKQASGECGWTQDEKLLSCLSSFSSK